jgi:hypothetical protein
MKSYAARNDARSAVEYGEKAVKISRDNVRAVLDVSRTYAGLDGYIEKALVYAKLAVDVALRLKNQPVPSGMNPATWTAWVNSINVSAQTNLSWVKQMDAWQRKQFLLFTTPRPAR